MTIVAVYVGRRKAAEKGCVDYVEALAFVGRYFAADRVITRVRPFAHLPPIKVARIVGELANGETGIEQVTEPDNG